MTRSRRSRVFREDGLALMYLAALLPVLLLFTGLALDSGRAYVVKAQLTKAVDGAALAAARNLNTGDPRGEAVRIFRANFPAGFLGTSAVTDPTADAGFFNLQTIPASGVNIVTVNATAVLPTTFMKLANHHTVTVTAMGEATRRMVDLSLVLDVSSSIGSKWGAVRDATRTFVNAFDASNDRVALVMFGNGADVRDQMRSSRGFDKATVISHIPDALPGGSTAMVQGLYRGWDELRSVPSGSQSGLRVLVLFTDGASNSVPALYDANPGTSRGLRTWDFPKNSPDPDNQTHDSPHIDGLYDTQSGGANPSVTLTTPWNSTAVIPSVPRLPLVATMSQHRSGGIPTTFPLQSSAINVDGERQDVARGLRSKDPVTNRYPAQVFNINNAARNLVEIIANEARNDNGDYRIRIYTIGMGELVRYNLGTRPETSESVLMRMANDTRSPDYASAQLEGKYYFAKTEADVGPAFQALQNQIIRLSK